MNILTRAIRGRFAVKFFSAVVMLLTAATSSAVEIEDVSKESPQLQLQKVRMQNGELRLELEKLRAEIMSLRGEFESLQHLTQSIEQKFEEEKNNHKKLHDTLSVNANADLNEDATSTIGVTQEGSAVSAKGDLETYEASFQLLKQKNYKAAEKAFLNYVKTFPQGEYVPNTHYWLGELALLENNIDGAQSSFKKVVAISPQHRKAADARYKLAQIYQRLGKDDEAKSLLQHIMQSTQKDSRAGRLAKTFWEKHYAK